MMFHHSLHIISAYVTDSRKAEEMSIAFYKKLLKTTEMKIDN